MRAMPFAVAALLGAALAGRAAPAAAQDLSVTVQYPPEGATLTASDSTFVFGRVEGASDFAVEVNGVEAAVDPGGGWLAYVPLDPGPFVFRATATAGDRTATAERAAVVPRPLFAPGPDSLPYKPETLAPTGALELYPGDTLEVEVVAAPGLAVSARLGGAATALAPADARDPNRGRQVWGDEEPVEGASPAVRAAAAAAAAGREPVEAPWVRYAASVPVRAGAAVDTLRVALEDSAGNRWERPLARVTLLDPATVTVALLDDDTANAGRTDHRVIARSAPGLGYQLFLPNGTVAGTARRDGAFVEIPLGPGTSAWAPAGETFPVAGPAPRDAIAVVRTRDAGDWSEVVLPTNEPLPFRIEQRLDPPRYVVDVYGLVSNVDFVETSIDDPLIDSVRWSQPANRVFRLDVALTGDRAWGWRAGWEGTHLVLGFRRPPDALEDRRFRSRLHGVRIVVDPGHNPDTGAVGPTGFEERQANLAIGLALAEILTARGADVVLTRATADSALALYDRTNLAVGAEGDVFVSIHNNALPDGVNPFVHNGTSVLFYHPQSEALAEAIQAELLPRTGLKDHGVWHQNVAVLRMNEMPSVLVECAFMMLPDQEAALRTPEFQRRIAEGIAAGIERWLEEGDR